MDLIDSILRSASAEAYIDLFKNNNIEASTLPVLAESDLEIIGVDKPDVRQAILDKSSKLQIPHEKKVDLLVTKEYAELVLSQIARQLYVHNACLSCALTRKDVIMCDIQLQKASECLLKCVTSLEQQLTQLENKLGIPKKRKKFMGTKNTFLIIGVSTGTLLLLGALFRSCASKS